MKNKKLRFVDYCLSDGLPCSSSVEGVGVGFEYCVKSRGDTVVICCRLSDVSILERSILEKDRFEVANWDE